MKFRLFIATFLFILSSASSYAGYFEDTVKQIVSDKIGGQFSIDLKFPPSAKLDQVIKEDDLIKSISFSFFSLESRSFKVVSVLSNNEEIELFGKFEAFFEILVASRQIKFGEVLTAYDVKTVKVKKLRAGEAAIKDLNIGFGMETKTNIMAGQTIKLSDLKKPPVIKENDPVTLVYSSSEITLKTLGISLSSGGVGEKIRVKNEKTGIVVFGEILDRNTVKVSTKDDK